VRLLPGGDHISVPFYWLGRIADAARSAGLSKRMSFDVGFL
jgi:hypothetical protein